MTDTETPDPVFDTSTAAGRLRILWGATADPDLVMTDNDVADVATVLREHADMAAELKQLRAGGDSPAADLAAFCEEWLKQNAGCDLIDHGFGTEHGGELTVTKLRAVLGELVRLRAQLAEIGDEWGYETKNGWSGWRRCISSMTEEYARKRAGESDRNRLVHRKVGKWHEVPDA